MLSERQRRELEARLRAALAEAWDGADDELEEIIGSMPIAEADAVPPSFWERLAAMGVGAVTPILIDAYLRSARKLARDRLGAEITVDWDRVNLRAQAWASSYSFRLVKGITDTSRDKLRGMVAEYVADKDMDLKALGARIGSMFGPVRGDMIAITEVTRAAAQGEKALVDEIRQDNPDLEIVEIWLTSQDERVCPICGPLHGKERGNGWDDPPPAHPRCRCAVGTDFVL